MAEYSNNYFRFDSEDDEEPGTEIQPNVNASEYSMANAEPPHDVIGDDVVDHEADWDWRANYVPTASRRRALRNFTAYKDVKNWLFHDEPLPAPPASVDHSSSPLLITSYYLNLVVNSDYPEVHHMIKEHAPQLCITRLIKPKVYYSRGLWDIKLPVTIYKSFSASALMAHMIAKINTDGGRPCAHCLGHRCRPILSICVHDPDLINGACTNCQFKGRAAMCTINQSDGSFNDDQPVHEVIHAAGVNEDNDRPARSGPVTRSQNVGNKPSIPSHRVKRRAAVLEEWNENFQMGTAPEKDRKAKKRAGAGAILSDATRANRRQGPLRSMPATPINLKRMPMSALSALRDAIDHEMYQKSRRVPIGYNGYASPYSYSPPQQFGPPQPFHPWSYQPAHHGYAGAYGAPMPAQALLGPHPPALQGTSHVRLQIPDVEYKEVISHVEDASVEDSDASFYDAEA